MITFARFNSLEAATDKRDYYNSLASDDPGFNLTDVRQHTIDPIWWFSATDCIENGGEGTEMIAEDVLTLDTFEVNSWFDLIALGYLPEPS